MTKPWQERFDEEFLTPKNNFWKRSVEDANPDKLKSFISTLLQEQLDELSKRDLLPLASWKWIDLVGEGEEWIQFSLGKFVYNTTITKKIWGEWDWDAKGKIHKHASLKLVKEILNKSKQRIILEQMRREV